MDHQPIGARVIGVHGMGNEHRGRNQLLRLWTDALDDGIEAARGRRSEALSLDIAYYGRIFLDGQASGVPAPKGDLDSADIAGDDELIEALTVAAGDRVAVEPGKGFPRTPRGIQMLLGAVDRRFGSGAGALYLGAFRQVRLYLTDSSVKAAIDAAVAAAVGASCRVLVAHSLGSVVAYEYLRRNPDSPVRTFVTLGSPLGLRMIRDRLEVRALDAVGAWHNVRDVRDPVTCGGQLRPFWPATLEYEVDNGRDPHAGVHYLGKRIVGSIVADG